jgi:uncharacterized protein YneF (UPF0154 family)
MSNGSPAPPQQPAKKGLPVWAWIGIGCGALIVLAMIVTMAGGFFIANKAKKFAAEIEDDPQAAAMMAAKTIVKLNPELEEVSSDKEAGTITIRNKATGEVITVNLEDIKEGKLSFTGDEGEVNIDASQLDETGSLKVTGKDGEVIFSSGEATDDVPSWVPLFPGTEPANRHAMKSGGDEMGGFELETTASVSDVLDFYREALTNAGFEVSVNTFSQDDTEGGMVNGNDGSGGRTATVLINSEGGGPTSVVVNFQQRHVE